MRRNGDGRRFIENERRVRTMQKIQEELVVNNIHLARFVASTYSNIDVDMDDLIGTAYEGLCKAALHYDHELQIKFSTYAVRVIQNTINLALRRYRRHHDREISWEIPINDDGSLCLKDMLADPEDCYEAVWQPTMTEILEGCPKLTDREKRIVTMLYKDEMTQNQVAEEMRLTQSYICKIHKNAIKKLIEQEVM